jgi:hypothetical protein
MPEMLGFGGHEKDRRRQGKTGSKAQPHFPLERRGSTFSGIVELGGEQRSLGG